MFHPGITIVIVPLISLSMDQVNKLKALHISAETLCGELSKDEEKKIFKRLKAKEIKLLYVTPEKITQAKRLKEALNKLYKENKAIARFVIDEGRC